MLRATPTCLSLCRPSPSHCPAPGHGTGSSPSFGPQHRLLCVCLSALHPEGTSGACSPAESLVSISDCPKALDWGQLWPQAPRTSTSKCRVFSVGLFSRLFFHTLWFRALVWESTHMQSFISPCAIPFYEFRQAPPSEKCWHSLDAPPVSSDLHLAPSVNIHLCYPSTINDFNFSSLLVFPFQCVVLAHGKIFSAGLSK